MPAPQTSGTSRTGTTSKTSAPPRGSPLSGLDPLTGHGRGGYACGGGGLALNLIRYSRPTCLIALSLPDPYQALQGFTATQVCEPAATAQRQLESPRGQLRGQNVFNNNE
jgi:hypothetical protein